MRRSIFEIKGTPFWRSAFFIRVLAVLLVAVLVIGLVRPANAAIAYRSASSGNNGGGATTLTINTPSGATVGDVLIFSGEVRSTGSVDFVPNGGWVLVNGLNNGSITKHTYYKILTSPPPSSFVFSINNGVGPTTEKASGGIIAYSGVDTANPINAQAIQSNASSTTATAPSITTTVPSAMIVALYGTATGTTSTQGSGMTERYDDASTSNGATSRTTSAGQDAVQASTGASGSKTMTMANAATNIGHTIALTPAPVVSQVGYRWFTNSTTAGTVGSPLANQDTAATVSSPGQPIRLRLLLGVTELQLPTSTAYKLQYKWQETGECTSMGSYNDITANTTIRYYDNSGVSDAASIVTSGSDPVRSGVTKVVQTYEEQNNFTVATAIPAGQDGMWDFALTISRDAEESGHYCIRAVTSTGGMINSYAQVPSLAMATKPTSIRGQEYRMFQNADSATPGSPLGATNASVTLGSTGDQFRLRAGLRAPGYFKNISTSGTHVCGISKENLAYCWGDDTYGQLGNNATLADQPTPVPVNRTGVLSGKTILSISAGNSHTCVIASDNLPYCWGIDQSGQLGNDATLAHQSNPVAVDMSGSLAGKTIRSISAGANNTCVVASDNQAYCWGADNNGNLGDDATLANQPTPVAVSTAGVLSGKTIQSISVGGGHVCAVASDNLAYCWGYDTLGGPLGDDATLANQPTPVAVSTAGVLSGKTIQSISAGDYHTCAIASDGQAYCWGYNDRGQLGNANTNNQPTPVAVSTAGVLSGKTVQSLTVGWSGTCATASDNLAYCWGDDSSGQLGDDVTIAAKSTPTAVSTSGVLSGKTILNITTGYTVSCAIASDNRTYCWGGDNSGELGDNVTILYQPTPVAVSRSNALTSKSVTGMVIGNSWSCALASATASCWGADSVGQLGDDADSVAQYSAVAVNTSGVLSGKTVQSISGIGDHACVVASDNLAYCWGGDAQGQLGNDATLANQRTPVAVNTSGVLAGKTIKTISAGGDHTCAIASDDLAYCWGDDSAGQLGNDATIADQATPVAVSASGALAGKTVVSISAGDTHTCAIASDNQAYCWGADYAGQLGNDGSLTAQPTPVAVSTSGVLSGKTVLMISAGGTLTCAIASDNQAYCWGSDNSGQLGNGTTTGTQATPSTVDTTGAFSGKTISSISAGNDHACAIASDNLAYCWGNNFNGQLGRGGATTGEISPGGVETTGALAGKTILKIYSGHRSSSCAVASDNKAYCWGYDIQGQLGDNTVEADQYNPVPVSDSLLSNPHIAPSTLALKLYYAQKTAPTCSAQTGFAEITNATPLAYHDNASVTTGTLLVHGTNNPVTINSIMPQTYYDSLPTSITNLNMITHGTTSLWDFSLRDNGAPASTSYCLKMVGTAGDDFAEYESFPEITTASGGGGPADTNAGLLRGGQSVVDGIKQLFSW